MNTRITVIRVWEYRHPKTKASQYQRTSWAKEINECKRVRKAPYYGVVEQTDNDFLHPTEKLVAVFSLLGQAEAAARLLQ